MSDIWQREQQLFAGGYKLVAGCDEVGRGPLAGPVVAAVAVFSCPGPDAVKDSKLLTPKRRLELQQEIIGSAVAIGIGVVDNEIIDRINILEATKLAMVKAWNKLSVKGRYLLVDALQVARLQQQVACEAVIGGDRQCGSIAAASIIAKVYRDRLMSHYDRVYPGYGFARHKGYPTKDHREALEALGPCPLHRRTFRGVVNE